MDYQSLTASGQPLRVVSVVGATAMDPVLRAIGDDVCTGGARLRSAIKSRRVNEEKTVFSLTAAVRDGFFNFLGTCWPLRAALPEKTP
jgi:hypothetical protein